MRVEEMALRSEIRQMLNEAGFNRETIKSMVKEAIDDIVKNQVNQALMEREEKDFDQVISNYLDSRMHNTIRNCAEAVIKEKLRWMDFNVYVAVSNNAEGKK